MIILGTDGLARAVASELGLRNDFYVQLSGFVSVRSGVNAENNLLHRPILASADELASIVVALEDRRNALSVRNLVRLRVRGIRVDEDCTTISALTGRIWLETLKRSWFVFSDRLRRSAVTLVVKRVIDLARTPFAEIPARRIAAGGMSFACPRPEFVDELRKHISYL